MGSKKYREKDNQKEQVAVSEPALSYTLPKNSLKVVKNISSSDKYGYLKVIQKGLDYEVLVDFMKMSDFHLDEVAKLLRLNSRTLRRLDKGKPLNMDISEKLVNLLRLYKLGLEIFGDTATFNSWLRRSIAGLGHQKPIYIMHTAIGIEIIMDELERLAYGVYS